MRKRMLGRRMMFHHMMGPRGFGPCGPGRGWAPPAWSDEDLLAMLQEYQRDLEQEVEDVAERIKRIKEEKANA